MWICSTEGFYSIVAHPTDEDVLVVRARSLGDLVAFRDIAHVLIATRNQKASELLGLKALASEKIIKTPMRDYAFRLFASRVAVGTVVGEIAIANSATNFKSAIAASQSQADKLMAYSRFHHEMEAWQRRREEAPRDWPVTPVFDHAFRKPKAKRKKPLAT